MHKISLSVMAGLAMVGALSFRAWSHCEIPCGIYDDNLRIEMMNEHITTIETSMKAVTELGAKEQHDANQMTRWVMNKEEHANKIQHIVAQYFLTQRIKIDGPNYQETLRLLHQMLVYSMKCKQTANLANTAKLRELVKAFQALYFK